MKRSWKSQTCAKLALTVAATSWWCSVTPVTYMVTFSDRRTSTFLVRLYYTKQLTHWPLGDLSELFYKKVIFKLILGWSISSEIYMGWMSQDFIDDKRGGKVPRVVIMSNLLSPAATQVLLIEMSLTFSRISNWIRNGHTSIRDTSK